MGVELGIHPDIPDEVYHQPREGVIRSTAVKHARRSAAHYRAWLDSGQKETAALFFGKAFHMGLLEPEKFRALYTVEPEWGDCRKTDKTTTEDGKANKTRRSEWRAANEGKVLLKAEDMDRISHMVAAIMRHSLAAAMLVGGVAEATVAYQDELTGLYGQVKADYYLPERATVVDVKTTEDAGIGAFAKSIANFGYHIQDALYRDAFRSIGKPIGHFIMIAVEKSAPYGVNIHTLDADGITSGYCSARQGIDNIAAAVKAGQWDCYPEHINTISLPRWAA